MKRTYKIEIEFQTDRDVTDEALHELVGHILAQLESLEDGTIDMAEQVAVLHTTGVIKKI